MEYKAPVLVAAARLVVTKKKYPRLIALRTRISISGIINAVSSNAWPRWSLSPECALHILLRLLRNPGRLTKNASRSNILRRVVLGQFIPICLLQFDCRTRPFHYIQLIQKAMQVAPADSQFSRCL